MLSPTGRYIINWGGRIEQLLSSNQEGILDIEIIEPGEIVKDVLCSVLSYLSS